MKIAFLENMLNIRGTSVALYDYAHYNETLLGNESIVLTRRYQPHVDACPEVHEKFRRRFPVHYYDSKHDIQDILDREKPQCLYVIKGGLAHDGLHTFQGVREIVHAVFDPTGPHGHVYCVISPWLNLAFGTHHPVLPHIVHLPESPRDLRSELGIPNDATVFGRYGGWLEFDHPAARQAVDAVSRQRGDIYFLFMNTEPFLSPRRNVLFVERSTDPTAKSIFVNTCDAMLYARARGETFGLAIGEFSSKNKPVFAPKDAPERMHHLILGDRAFWYANADDLCRQLLAFDRASAKREDWNAYRDYAPDKVMRIFQDIIGKSDV